MQRAAHFMATHLDSPLWDRGRLTIDGRTAADDLAELGAGEPGDGSVGVETEPDAGTLQGDFQDFDLAEGYHDEPPADASLEEDHRPAHDYQKRHADTRAALDKERAEKAALQAQLEALQRDRMQPAQPNILQPGQTGVDPLAQIDREYQDQKLRLRQEVMGNIKRLNRQDPNIQDKIADLWAEHAERIGELDGTRRERRMQAEAQQQAYYRQVQERETTRALTQAGLDPVQDRDAFIDKVAVLNARQPGWDAGMTDAQTYDYVVAQLQQGGYRSSVNTQQSQQQLTPRQQHQALRHGALGAVKPGARHDPAKPGKPKLPEEKDISWHDQLRKAKRARIVTEEQAMRLKTR